MNRIIVILFLNVIIAKVIGQNTPFVKHSWEVSQNFQAQQKVNLSLDWPSYQSRENISSSYSETYCKNNIDTAEEKKHSPKLASIYSAVLPGLGQAYNRKYWKVPLVLAGLGISGYYIFKNRDSMRLRQDALIARLDNDTNTRASGNFANTPIDILRADRNQYRTYRDFSIIAFGVIYLLNIVDASVDAHFYKFNIDKPLAQQKQRHLYFVSSKVQGKPTLGLSYRW